MYVGNQDGQIWYYRNDGDSFVKQSSSLEGVDVGAYANPYFVDDDNDGDLDMYVGNWDGYILYYRNDGDSFVRQSSSLDDVDVGKYADPYFVDIDNDGDFDAFIGNEEGQIWYYRNDGSSTSPSLVRQTLAANPFNGVDVGFESAPYFVDDDNDGDMDMYVGNRYGEIWYYRNDGSSTSPSFTRQSSSLDGVDVGGNANPYFVDDDNDGDMDLYVGNNAGEIWYYRNDGSSTSPSFTRHSSSVDYVDVGAHAKPFFIVKPDHCVDCPSGSVSLTGSLFCSVCQSGQYAEDNNCKSCPHGFSSSAGSISCSECAAGLYYADGGCKVCTAGRGSSVGSTGSSSCSDCEAGKYGNGGCKPCAVGMYQNENGQTACKSCAFGSSLYGSDRCGCIDGEINIIQTTAKYTFVQKDSYGDGGSTITVKNQGVVIMNSIMPTSGEEGKRKETEFEVERGSTYSFTVVVDGYPYEQSYEILNNYKDVVKAFDFGILKTGVNNFNFTVSSCSKCPSGTYVFDGVCKSCPVGTSSPIGSPGSSSCFECEAGKYADGDCKSCPSGKYQDESGKGECKSCPSGKYQDESGKGECKSCPSGQYQNQNGQTECTECASGFSSPVGSSSCTCPAGKYGTQTAYYSFIQRDSYGDGGSTVTVTNNQDVVIMTSTMKSGGITQEGFISGITQEGFRKETPFEVETGTYFFTLEILDNNPQEQSYKILNEHRSTVKYADVGDLVKENTFSYIISAVDNVLVCKYCPAGQYQEESGKDECVSCPAGKALVQDFTGDYTHESVNAEYSIGYSWSTYCDVYNPSDVRGNANCKAGYTLDDAKDYCSSNEWCVKIMYFGRCTRACNYWKTDRDRYWFLQVGGSSPTAELTADADVYSKRYVSSCYECTAGKYSDGSDGVCKSCTSGRYQVQTGQASCTKCVAGQYMDEIGSFAANCKVCTSEMSHPDNCLSYKYCCT
jgi:hypothetical protein